MANNVRRIAVMTSGGDAPGMNGAVRAVVRMAIARGCEAWAIYEGYDGLVNGGDLIKNMVWEDVRGWLSEGGTLIGTARCKAFMERKGRLAAAKNLITRGINALVVCGGDGSLTGADTFRKEWPSLIHELVKTKECTQDEVDPFEHLNIVGLVGSIDNDMSSTDATIGCYTSLSRICEAVDSIDSTASSHQRAFVIEVMGRHCGWLALMAGVSTGADNIFIPEHPPADGWEEEMCEVIRKHRKLGKRKTIVIVAEGAHDRHLKKISPDKVKTLLSERLKLDTRVTTLGHVQRGGSPCSYDRMLGTLQGVEAVEAVLSATPDTPSPVICIVENKIVRKPLLEAVKLTHEVSKAIEAKDFSRAMSLRDNEFQEYYHAFLTSTAAEQPEMLLPPEKVSHDPQVYHRYRADMKAENENRHNTCWSTCWWHECGDACSSCLLPSTRTCTGRATQRLCRLVSTSRRQASRFSSRGPMVRSGAVEQQSRKRNWN